MVPIPAGAAARPTPDGFIRPAFEKTQIFKNRGYGASGTSWNTSLLPIGDTALMPEGRGSVALVGNRLTIWAI